MASVSRKSRILNLDYALNILKRQTGINQLRPKTVLPENAPIPPAPRGNRRIGPLPEAGPPIVAVCSTLGSSFHNRPSQAQVDHLKKILGGDEAKWWINVVISHSICNGRIHCICEYCRAQGRMIYDLVGPSIL